MNKPMIGLPLCRWQLTDRDIGWFHLVGEKYISSVTGYGAFPLMIPAFGDDLDMDQLRNEGWFETYQCFQSKPVFDGCTHIVSVIGEDATASRFVGIYEVQGSTTASPALLPEHCPYTQWGTESRVF